MNAVLQALAHSQELCMAMDVEPHSASCPIAKENADRSSNSPSPDYPVINLNRRSSRPRRTKKSPSPDAGSNSFCALCEVEHHLEQVHSNPGVPVAPTAFVNGFIDHVAPWFKLGVQEDSHEFLRLLIDAMQKSCSTVRTSGEDTEYPFQLFRGTVESNVQCESCHTSRSTTDPIEDIGLDVSAKTATGTSTPPPNALADVSSAFSRFARAEILEGYKCEKCCKVGKATKQSRLASIPPILTLHLKRFRYGTSVDDVRKRSEISQLLARDASGKSGSAKIEGHVKFEQFFDLKPFLTESLQGSHKSMFCRLFAVIVHAGTNSHSGHYIAYVRNIAKNEWWKMDDARVTQATSEEVLAAQAYMLFYRVVEHPTVVRLREQHKALVSSRVVDTTPAVETAATTTIKPVSSQVTSADKKRKRELPDHSDGEEWARKVTKIPPNVMSVFRRAEELLSENMELKSDYFSNLMREAKEEAPPTDPNPQDDIQDGPHRFRPGVLDMIWNVWKEHETNIFNFGLKKDEVLNAPVVDTSETLL
jgi:ubiquitin C-terminal hydrolase